MKHIGSSFAYHLLIGLNTCQINHDELALCTLHSLSLFYLRDSIGENAISGDQRWAGSYGVNIDFVARSHCAVEVIAIEHIQARTAHKVLNHLHEAWFIWLVQ